MMKTKVTMTCILKSGRTITETVKVDRNNNRVFNAIDDMRKSIENYLGRSDAQTSGNITFGHTTICISEIAAISFKD
jgi:hypothetical protein